MKMGQLLHIGFRDWFMWFVNNLDFFFGSSINTLFELGCFFLDTYKYFTSLYLPEEGRPLKSVACDSLTQTESSFVSFV